jgi:AraC-like DNA-binding protein
MIAYSCRCMRFYADLSRLPARLKLSKGAEGWEGLGQTGNANVSKRMPASRFVVLRTVLAGKMVAHLPAVGENKTAIPGLSLHRRTAPAPCLATTLEPSLAVFVQGRKRVTMGGTTYLCDESTFLLTSVDVPVVSQIFATEETPYLASRLALEIPLVREIISREDLPEPAVPSQTRGIAVGKTTVELLSACSRLLDILNPPEDIPFLGAMIQREIVYRWLRGPQGERLRAIATLVDRSHRTARAMAWLRSNCAKPLRVEQLAKIARMGRSTLHHHFRALTAMAPCNIRNRFDWLPRASACSQRGWMQPVRHLKLGRKARASSTASTNASSASPRCGTSKPVDSPSRHNWPLSTDRASHSRRHHLSGSADGHLALRQSPPVMQVPPARHLHQRLPHRVHQVVLDQQVPEAVRALIEIRHGKVERD